MRHRRAHFCYRLSPGPALVWRTHRLVLNIDAHAMLLPIAPHLPINATQLPELLIHLLVFSWLGLLYLTRILLSVCLPNSYSSINAQLWCPFAQQVFPDCIPSKWAQCVSLFTPLIIFMLIICLPF